MSGRFKSKRGGSRGGFRGGYSKKRSSPSDDDVAPRASKRTKAAVDDDDDEEPTEFVPKLQKDHQGGYFVALNPSEMRRVTIGEFKGKTLVSIREYWKNDDDKILPGKKGISLTLDQYNAFVAALPLVESALTKRGDKVVRPQFDGTTAATEVDEVEEEEQEEEEADVKEEDDEDEEE